MVYLFYRTGVETLNLYLNIRIFYGQSITIDINYVNLYKNYTCENKNENIYL